jgi:hypothetical protein
MRNSLFELQAGCSSKGYGAPTSTRSCDAVAVWREEVITTPSSDKVQVKSRKVGESKSAGVAQNAQALLVWPSRHSEGEGSPTASCGSTERAIGGRDLNCPNPDGD